MSTPLEQRVVELERRSAVAERTAEELSAVVAEQAKTIDVLVRRVRYLTDRVQSAESTLGERSPQDDKPPPHY
jgi:SlyX protein